MRHASVLWLAACGALAACSQIVGAEFDGLEPLDPSSGGSVAGSAGAPGGSGNSSGGAMSSGGSSAGKAGSGGGGAGKGGSSGDGGTAGSAGNTLSGGSAGEGGSAGSAGVGGSDGGAGTGGNAGSSGSAGTGGGGAGAGGGGQCPGTGGVSGETGIVINEIKGQGGGSDFIEVFNKSSEPVDVSNYYLTDDSGNQVVFSGGTTICGRSYVLALLGQATPGGPFTCLGFSPCFWGTWGVSAGGEAVFLYDSAGTILDDLVYPDEQGPDAVTDLQTYGRLTDGSESLGPVVPSAGQLNQAAN